MSLGIAIRAFTAALFDQETAEKIRLVLDGGITAAVEQKAPTLKSDVASPEPKQPARSEAVTLLSALQREARLVDLIQEDLTLFSDAQVGAAARPCLQASAATLKRLFDLKPICDSGEGSTVEIGPSESPARYQWVGEGSAASGHLVHHGWQAAHIELPQWHGDAADASVVAPAQVQR